MQRLETGEEDVFNQTQYGFNLMEFILTFEVGGVQPFQTVVALA